MLQHILADIAPPVFITVFNDRYYLCYACRIFCGFFTCFGFINNLKIGQIERVGIISVHIRQYGVYVWGRRINQVDIVQG